MAGRKPVDRTGHKYGRLTAYGIISLTPEGRELIGRPRSKDALWLCRCECGRWSPVSASALTAGHTKGCGVCYWKSAEARQMSRRNGAKAQERLLELYGPDQLDDIRAKAIRKAARKNRAMGRQRRHEQSGE